MYLIAWMCLYCYVAHFVNVSHPFHLFYTKEMNNLIPELY